jgi:predicted RNase H-like HicB family nuclease
MPETPVEVTYTVRVHAEEGSLWAQVDELPGVFASGDTVDELEESLAEAIGMVLSSEKSRVEVRLSGRNRISDEAVEEQRFLVSC